MLNLLMSQLRVECKSSWHCNRPSAPAQQSQCQQKLETRIGAAESQFVHIQPVCRLGLAVIPRTSFSENRAQALLQHPTAESSWQHGKGVNPLRPPPTPPDTGSACAPLLTQPLLGTCTKQIFYVIAEDSASIRTSAVGKELRIASVKTMERPP